MSEELRAIVIQLKMSFGWQIKCIWTDVTDVQTLFPRFHKNSFSSDSVNHFYVHPASMDRARCKNTNECAAPPINPSMCHVDATDQLSRS